jgi:hypothetical protein
VDLASAGTQFTEREAAKPKAATLHIVRQMPRGRFLGPTHTQLPKPRKLNPVTKPHTAVEALDY